MRKSLRLTAALLASLAFPALAQTPSVGSPSTSRTPAPPASTAVPPIAPPTTTTTPTRPGTTSTAPSTTTATPSTTPRSGTTATTTTTPATPGATTPTSPGRTTGTAAGTAGAAATTSSTRTAATGNKIDINSATEQQLDTLPGVGPARAKGIVSGRPWDDLNDLVKKGVLPQNVLDGVKARLALANINTSSAADLAKTLPGIGEVRSRAIVNGRPYAQPQDLVSKGVLTSNQFDKIKDLIAF